MILSRIISSPAKLCFIAKAIQGNTVFLPFTRNIKHLAWPCRSRHGAGNNAAQGHKDMDHLSREVLPLRPKPPKSKDSGGFGGDKRDRTADLLNAMDKRKPSNFTLTSTTFSPKSQP